jgi:hypothetical protein
VRSVEDEIRTHRDVSGEADSAVAPPAESSAPPPSPVGGRSDPAPADEVPPPKRVASRLQRRSRTTRTSSSLVTRRVEETATHRLGGVSRRTIQITDENGKVGTYQSIDEMPPNVRAMYESLTKDLSFGIPDEWLATQSGVVESIGSPKVTPRRRRSAPPPPVAGVSVQEIGDSLRLTRRWWHNRSIIVAVFVTPLLVWAAAALFRDSPTFGRGLACFGVIPGLIGATAAYYLLCLLFNRTVIDVNNTSISIRHGPLPCSSGQQVKANELDQLYVPEKVTRNKHGATYSYDLWAITPSGLQIKLLKDMPDPRQAKYLEKAIENRLGIVDRPVPEEWV